MDCHKPTTSGDSPSQESSFLLDDMGFLVLTESWSQDFLDRFAWEEGIPSITEAHRSLVNYAREFFLQRGRSPMPPEYARHARCSMKRIHELFPKGLMSIHRLAGLPQPKSC